MKRLPLSFLAIAVTFLVLACSSSGGSVTSSVTPTGSLGAPSDSPAAPGGSPASLDGHTYLSTDIQEATLVPGTRVKLAFLAGGVNADAGCNTIGGKYTIDGDKFTAPRLGMTEIGCDGPLMQQDQWLASLLGNAKITIAGDTLTLTDGTATLTLVDKEVATPDLPLEGTHWVLDGIASGDAVSNVPVGVAASIQITAGRADVMAGCNSGGAPVAVEGSTLMFGPIALTKMACEGGAMAVEAAFIATLSGPVSYTIDADVLTLHAGDAGLTFRAAP
jgi:heat shock protein HslJ